MMFIGGSSPGKFRFVPDQRRRRLQLAGGLLELAELGL